MLVPTECLPVSASIVTLDRSLVLGEDIAGRTYNLEMRDASIMRSLSFYRLERAKYVSVTAPAYLRHEAYQPVFIEPGLYRVRKQSEYTYKKHGGDVARVAVRVGEVIGLDQEHLKELELACHFHDIGLTGLEDALWKTQWFTDADWQVALQHPVRGAEIVNRLKGKVRYATDRTVQYVLHHHEHMDGSGYPHGLKGEDIPLGSRIMLIVDAFDAMKSWRPFREPLPEHVAMDRLWGDAGYRYDLSLLEVFASVLDDLALDDFTLTS